MKYGTGQGIELSVCQFAACIVLLTAGGLLSPGFGEDMEGTTTAPLPGSCACCFVFSIDDLYTMKK